MRKLLPGIFILILLAGCGQPRFYYDRPGATPAMFEEDSAECKSLARQMGTEKRIGASIGFSTSEIGPGRAAADGSFMDTGDDQYYRQYQECLRRRGWKKVPTPRR